MQNQLPQKNNKKASFYLRERAQWRTTQDTRHI